MGRYWANVGDQSTLNIDTMLPARTPRGWQWLALAKGSRGVVVAQEAAGWKSTAKAERLEGGLVEEPGAISIWLDGREYAVPNSMIAAGQVSVVKQPGSVSDPAR